MPTRQEIISAFQGGAPEAAPAPTVPALNLADLFPVPDQVAPVEKKRSGDVAFLGPLGDLIDIIDTPRAAIASTVQELVDVFQGEGFSPKDWWQQTSDNHLFGEVLRDSGVDLPGPLDFIVGLGLDVAFDPLTYFAGAGVAARLAKADDVVVALAKAAKVADGLGDTAKAAKLTQASNRVRRTRSVLAAGDALDDIGISSGARLTLPGTGRLGRNLVEKPLDALTGGGVSTALNKRRVAQVPDFLVGSAGFKVADHADEIGRAMSAMARNDAAVGAFPEAVQAAAGLARRMPVEAVRLPGTVTGVAFVAAQPGRAFRYATQKKLGAMVDKGLSYRQKIRFMKLGEDPDAGLAAIYLERAGNLGEVASRRFHVNATNRARNIMDQAEKLGVPVDDLLRASDRPWGSPEMPDTVVAAGQEFHASLLDFWTQARASFNEVTGVDALGDFVGDLYAARYLSPEGKALLSGTDSEVFTSGALFGSPLERRTYVTPGTYAARVAEVGEAEVRRLGLQTKFMGRNLEDVGVAGRSVRDQMNAIGAEVVGDGYKELFSDDFVNVVTRYISDMSQGARVTRLLAELEDVGVIVRGDVRAVLSERLGALVKREGQAVSKRKGAVRSWMVANNRSAKAAAGGTKVQREAAQGFGDALVGLEADVDGLVSELAVFANSAAADVGPSLRGTVIQGAAERLGAYAEQANLIGFRLEQLKRLRGGMAAAFGDAVDPAAFKAVDDALGEAEAALTALNVGAVSGALDDSTVRAARQVIDIIQPISDRGAFYGGVRLRASVLDDPALHNIPKEVNGWGNPDHRAVVQHFDNSDQTLRGRSGQMLSLDDARIPDRLYHVTVAGRSVDEGGVLRIGQNGGLGGDATDRMVSFTASREVAEQLRNDFELRRKVALLADRGDRDGVRALLARESRRWGVEKFSRERAKELAGSRNYPKSRRLPEYEWEWRLYAVDGKFTYSEVFDGFLRGRHTAGGPRDPLFFGGDDTLKRLAGKSASDIRIVEVPKVNLGRSGAAITDFDTGAGFLDEIRVYGDVPVWSANDMARKGLVAPTPSKPVANWGRIYTEATALDDTLNASTILHETDAAYLDRTIDDLESQVAQILNDLDTGAAGTPLAGRTVGQQTDLLNRQLFDTRESIAYQSDGLAALRAELRSTQSGATIDAATSREAWGRHNDLLVGIKDRIMSLQADIAEARRSPSLRRRISAAESHQNAVEALNNERNLLGFQEAYNEALSNQLSGKWFDGYTAVNTGETNELFVDALHAAARINDPVEMGEFTQKYAKLVNWWKAQAVATPGFILRNGYGGVWINTQIGGVEMGMHTKVVALAKTAIKAGNGDLLAGSRVLARGGKPVKLSGVTGVGRTASVRDLEAFAAIVDSGLASGGQAWSEVTDALGELGGKGIFRNVGGTANPLDPNFAPFKAVRNGNERMEFMLRGAMAMDALTNKGKSLDEAWDLVRKYHFDYSELTTTEQRIKLAIPFWKWQRSVLPILVESLGKNPKAWGRLQQFKGEMELTSEKEGLVPEYFGESLGIRLPFMFQGSRVYALPDLPFKDMARYLKEPTSPVRTLAEGAIPFAKLPIELWSGKRVFADLPFSGRFQQVPNSYAKIPGLMNVLEALGKVERNAQGEPKMRDRDIYILDQFLPVFGRLRRLFPNEEGKQRRLMSTWMSTMLGGGLRTNDPTEKRSQWFKMQREFQADVQDRVDIQTRRV